ncbi:MAG TPA: response regulator transcription factor [Rhizomicrobium sp.]
MRILFVEDDATTARAVEMIFKGEGCSVHHTDNAQEAIQLAKLSSYDLIVLDLILPDMHGHKVLTTLRLNKIHTPVMVLSGDATVDMRVKMLGAGADDYLLKPFHKDELLARSRAIVRRALSHSQSIIVTGKVSLNLNEKTVSACGTSVHLTVKEYQVLEALALRKGSALSKDTLLNQLYGGMDEPEMKIIDVFICKLRKKLALATGGECYIHTVWGHGYQLKDPQEAPFAQAA